MADFSRLPNEMISEIWSNTHQPEDVKNFALVSKRVYAVGRPFVEEHNKLKKDFSFMEIGMRMSIIAPASLLKNVLLQPRIALYVTHLSFSPFRYGWDVTSDHRDKRPKNVHVLYPSNIMALFTETIRKSSFVPQNETLDWITKVEARDEDPIFALLCMLLPNISMMTLMGNGFVAEKSQETILRIAEAGKTLFLTRLVTVHIVCESYGDEIILNWLRMFAALPSVQSLHVQGMRLEEAEVDLVHNAQQSYTIRNLAFIDSGVHPKILVQLLDNVNGLKVFSYVRPNDTFCRFEPFWIWSALLANAMHSLEYLRILPLRTQAFGFLGTLRGFTALKELETVVSLLCRGSGFDGLANLLPSSIKRIYLDTRSYKPLDIVPRIVEEIVKAKPRLIPHLKALEFQTKASNRITGRDRRMIESLDEKCRNVGIELKIFFDGLGVYAY